VIYSSSVMPDLIRHPADARLRVERPLFSPKTWAVWMLLKTAMTVCRGHIAAQSCKTLAFASLLAHSFLRQVPAGCGGRIGNPVKDRNVPSAVRLMPFSQATEAVREGEKGG
jgi:hypothetical protein